MNSDILPTTIVIVILIEFVYGLFYNWLWNFSKEHKFMNVSFSVAVGVISTLVIPAITWFNVQMRFWEAVILMLMCFMASGFPMIVGSAQRTLQEERDQKDNKDQKKRQRWPNRALRARDNAIIDITMIANDIAEDVKEGKLTVTDLPALVNRLHIVIGTLKGE